MDDTDIIKDWVTQLVNKTKRDLQIDYNNKIQSIENNL